MGTKVKDFIAALESGETKEKAIEISGCSPSTASIQFAQWKKGNKTGQVVFKKEKVEKVIPNTPGIPLPKKGK